MMLLAMPDSALSDLRVIESAQGIAGPYCGKLFADLGAQVIKVEPPAGDSSRRQGPFPDDLPHDEKSGLFLHLNTGKQSVTIDISVPSGQAVFRKLLANADVLIESDGPSRTSEWELSYEDVKSEFPNLVYVSVTPFGCTGPYKDYQANSLLAMAMSSIMYNTGDPDREPLATGGTPADYIAGIHAWIGALAAIAYCAKDGSGQHVDVSLVESALSADEYNAAMYAYQGAVRRRYYSRHIFVYPSDIFACQDGYVCVIGGAAGFPQRGITAEDGGASPMSLLLGDPELDKQPLFSSGQQRILNWREFDALIEPHLSSRPAKEIVELAQALRMPFAAVPSVKDLLEDEHLAARNFFQKVEHPEAGELVHTGVPFHMSETPPSIGRAPALGEHNETTLSELGYSQEEQTILFEYGVT
jgi:crotonobetainyl-CoA:carnitine CoA-transferase CaiB-like acyl-CoA transferase